MIARLTAADAEACLRIYRPFVEETVVTLETVTPSLEEFSQRALELSSFYPYLTWKEKGEVLGFVYGRHFRDRAACDWVCESGIYLDERIRGKGIGRRMYMKFFDCLRAMNVVSVIGAMRSNSSSAEFHRRMGFVPLGRIPNAGFKLGQWCDLELWQYRLISPLPTFPPPVIPFSEVAHTVTFSDA